MAKYSFEFQPLTETDLPLLCEWLNRPHLQRWWRSEQALLPDIREKYLPRIAGTDDAKPYLALLDGEPVGYIQYYSVSDGNPGWWPDEPGTGVLGIDQFLADGHRLGQGIGTGMITAFVRVLLRNPEVREIRVDPRPDNIRAIRCYAKVGFRKIGPITTPDGPAIMMVLEQESFQKGE